MAAPTVIARITGFKLGTLFSKVIDLPVSGIVAGDSLIMFYTHTYAGATASVVSAGWTILAEGRTLLSGTPTGPYHGVAIYRCNGAENNKTVTLTTGNPGFGVIFKCIIIHIRGASNHALVPWTISAIAQNPGTGSTTPDSGNVAPAGGANDYLVFSSFGANINDSNPTVPTGYGNRTVFAASAPTVATAELTINAASENPGSWTIASSQRWAAFTLAVPAALQETTSLIPDFGGSFLKGFIPTVTGGTANNDYAVEVLKRPSCRSYYKLNEALGATQILDSSGNGHHSVLIDSGASPTGYPPIFGEPTLLTNGEANTAAKTPSPSNQANRTVSWIPTSGDRYPKNELIKEMTVCGWIKIVTFVDGNYLILSCGNAGSFLWTLQVGIGGNIQTEAYSAAGVAGVLNSVNGVVLLNEICFLAVTRTATGAVKYYKNGVEVAASPGEDQFAITIGKNASYQSSGIGVAMHPRLVNANALDITYQHLAVFEEVLDLAAIAALYEAGTTPDVPPPSPVSIGVTPVAYVGYIANAVPVETIGTPGIGVVPVRITPAGIGVVPVREAPTEIPRVKVKLS